MLTIHNSCSWSCTVSLLDRARELKVDFSYDRFSKLVDRIERLKYVDQVEDGHQFWCTIEPETSNVVVAQRRVEAVLAKIERLLLQYRETKP